MAMIQAASAERRPELATLPDAQAVVEALLQHTLGLTPDRAELAPATQALIDRAVAMLGAVEPAEAPRVGDAAALTGDLYRLIDEGLADPGRALREAEQPPPPEGAAAARRRASAAAGRRRASTTTSRWSCRPS